MARFYTVGHSNRPLEEFLEILQAHRVRRLVDVRRFPGSRRYPHFGKDALAGVLPTIGIEYVHEPDLGGRRKPQPDSPNTYWRNDQFRAYADHLAAPEFQAALARVVAAGEGAAVMCSEAVPWRCHRQLIADVLVAAGHEVLDILTAAKATPHKLNEHAALVRPGVLVYRSSEPRQLGLALGEQ